MLVVALSSLGAAGCESQPSGAAKGDSGATGTGGEGASGAAGAGAAGASSGLGGSPDAGAAFDAAAGSAGGDADGAGGRAGSGSGTAGSPPDASFADANHGDANAGQTSDGGTTAWTGTWAAAPQSCGGTFTGQTLRAIVHTSIGGSAARVRFSNTFGNGPLQVRDVHVAQRATGASIDLTTDKTMTFGGQRSLNVPAGADAVSDAADFAAKALSDVAVSFFVVSHSGATCHQSGFQTNYQASGDVAGDKTLSGGTNGSYYFLSNLDVQSPGAEGAVVTLGASITDGYRSNGDDNKRWPNDLAVRLVAAGRAVGVLNQGISGDGVANAVKRFDRDVLSQPNVKWVIFSDNPINDLSNFDPPAQTEIDQVKTMIASAPCSRGEVPVLHADTVPGRGRLVGPEGDRPRRHQRLHPRARQRLRRGHRSGHGDP